MTKDVAPRMLVVGDPARVLRSVSDEELLENQVADFASVNVYGLKSGDMALTQHSTSPASVRRR